MDEHVLAQILLKQVSDREEAYLSLLSKWSQHLTIPRQSRPFNTSISSNTASSFPLTNFLGMTLSATERVGGPGGGALCHVARTTLPNEPVPKIYARSTPSVMSDELS
jgi:hypothetical protein